jgi:hypothetical protein
MGAEKIKFLGTGGPTTAICINIPNIENSY